MVRKLTCIECPMGCSIDVATENGIVTSVCGNGCARGKAYVESEVTHPVRVVTSVVRAHDGQMIPVKTDKPVSKEKIFEVMKTINETHPASSVKIGDVLVSHIEGDANLIATGNSAK